jgi:hypothetical protein
MHHEQCQCPDPTGSCPRYGWMKGFRWEYCQGKRKLTDEQRDKVLDSYLLDKESRSGAIVTTPSTVPPPVPVQKVPATPSIFVKAIRFLKAGVRYVAAGLPIITEEAYAKRRSICDACEYRTKNDTCGHPDCGCRLKGLVNKLQLATEKCPAKKWGQELPIAETK